MFHTPAHKQDAAQPAKSFNLQERVIAALNAAQKKAAPFIPSHAEVAAELAPVVNEILAMPRQEAIEAFRGLRPGTWDVHVLAEVKSAWRLDLETIGKKR